MESLRSKSCPQGSGSAENQAIQGHVAEALLEAKCLVHSLRQEGGGSDSEQGHSDDQEMQYIGEPEEAADDMFQHEGGLPRQSCWTEDKEEIDASSEEMVPGKEKAAERPEPGAPSQPVNEPPAKQARTGVSARAAPY